MIDRTKFKATSIFLILQEMIDRELQNIEAFINETATDLTQKQAKLQKEYSEYLSVDGSADETIQNGFEDEYNHYFNVFPFYSFNPSLLMLYGFLENWLKRLCDYHNNRGFVNLTVSDLAGSNYIEKSRRYLTLIAEVHFTAIENEWKRIGQIQKLRNCIAHQGSNIRKNKNQPIKNQELFVFVSTEPRIAFDEKQGDFYIRDKTFLLDFIGQIRTCLYHLTSELAKPKVHARNTSMPHDNTNWGQEKSEQLLKMVISGLQMLDINEKRTDEWKDSDLKFNMRGHFATMAWNLTKLYSFFCDGDWSTSDSSLIVSKREEGLKELKKLYNAIDFHWGEEEGDG